MELLQKGETVTKGLRRLGGSETNKKKNKAKSWQREKVYDLEADDSAGAFLHFCGIYYAYL